MCIFDFLRDYKDAFTSLSSLIAVGIFGFGVYQYNRAERWKRTEFLAKLYSEFVNDKRAILAGWMLDGDTRKIAVTEGAKKKLYTIDWKIIIKALREFSDDDEFSSLDLYIRDCFDSFFSFIEQFERAIQNGLVDQDDVRPYFVYWIDILNGRWNAEDGGLTKAVLAYIDYVGFDDVTSFLKRWSA